VVVGGGQCRDALPAGSVGGSGGGVALAEESCVELPSVLDGVKTTAASHGFAPSGASQVKHGHFD